MSHHVLRVVITARDSEGFIKLPYDRALPIALLKRLIKARLEEFNANGAGW